MVHIYHSFVKSEVFFVDCNSPRDVLRGHPLSIPNLSSQNWDKRNCKPSLVVKTCKIICWFFQVYDCLEVFQQFGAIWGPNNYPTMMRHIYIHNWVGWIMIQGWTKQVHPAWTQAEWPRWSKGWPGQVLVPWWSSEKQPIWRVSNQ